MSPEKFLTSTNYTPTQVLLAAGIKGADTIMWGDLESAQHDLNVLLGNNSATIFRDTVAWKILDSAANVVYDFSSESNQNEFRVLIIAKDETGLGCEAYVRWKNKKIHDFEVSTRTLGRYEETPSLSVFQKLYNALMLVGMPVLPFVDWVIERKDSIDFGSGIRGAAINKAVLNWVKNPLVGDKVLLGQAQYVVSSFAGLPAIASREFEAIPYANEIAQGIRTQMWHAICSLTASAYGLSFDHGNKLWWLTLSSTDHAMNKQALLGFETIEDCNSAWGSMCANIQRAHHNLHEALKGLI